MKTEYNTDNKISISTTGSLDESDGIPLNNYQTASLDELGGNRIILPAS